MGAGCLSAYIQGLGDEEAGATWSGDQGSANPGRLSANWSLGPGALVTQQDLVPGDLVTGSLLTIGAMLGGPVTRAL